VPAWDLLDAESRRVFRKESGYDDAWQRGWGWSLATALVALPYYWDTVPDIAEGPQDHRHGALRGVLVPV